MQSADSLPPPPFIDRSSSTGESSTATAGGMQSSYAAQREAQNGGEDLFQKFGMDRPVDKKGSSSSSSKTRLPPPLPPSASSRQTDEKIKPSYSTGPSRHLPDTSAMDSEGEEDDEEDERAAVEGQILQEREAGKSTSKGKQKKKVSAADEEGEGGESISNAKANKVATAGSEVFGYDKASLGTTALPIARVQRIIKADQEMENTSKEAVFLIAAAAELFIKHISDLAYTQAKLDKNRKVVHYRDVQRAVQKDWTLEFLQELVPPSMPLSAALVKRQTKLEENLKIEAGVMDGQETGEDEEEGEDGEDANADEGDAKDGGKPKKVKHSGKTWLQKFVSKQQGGSKKAKESMEADGGEEEAKAGEKDREQAQDEAEDNDDDTDDDLPDVASAARQAHEENVKARGKGMHKASNGRAKINHRTVAPAREDSDSDMQDA